MTNKLSYTIEQLMELYNQGLTYAAIGEKLNVSRSSIASKCRRMGLVSPNKGVNPRGHSIHKANKPAKVKNQPNNRYTNTFVKPFVRVQLTKQEMRDQLLQAVLNTGKPNE
jgi:hypothetical protein